MLPLLALLAATIRTDQTSIALLAEDTRPQLVRLGEWANTASEPLIASVTMNGVTLPVTWKLNPAASRANTVEVSFVYDSVSPKLRLTWEWRDPASTGPIEHSIHIQNLESANVWIPLQDSLRLRMPVDSKVGLQHFYVEKGAGKPSRVGTHEAALPVGYRWTGTSSTYAHPLNGQPQEVIPFFAVEKTGEARNGWYVGVEFSGRTRLTVNRDSGFMHGAIGLNPDPGPFRTRLKPQETFDTPPVFIGVFAAGIDSLGNQLRPWVRKVLGNARTWENPNYPLLVNNSWGGGMQVDEALALRMIRDSHELGLEMFHIDAGWFRGVGDWYPDPKKFPRGLAAIADEAHRQGLKFGMWVDWSQAGLDTQPGALNLRDQMVHGWAVSDLAPDWKPDEFKGQTIDIGAPAAHAYAKQEVLRIVEDYHLDMLEHDGYLVADGCIRDDHPHAPPDHARVAVTKDQGSYFVESSNSTDVSYHAVRAYYDIYANLRHRHPNVLLEICNDGGRMVDFGSAAHGDYFSITDSYDPVSNRQAFYDASHLLPAAMLEAYVQKWPAPTIGNFRYMLRSGMMGWLTIMLDTNAWTASEHAAAKEEIRTYKQELRQFIRDADIYHIGARPDGVHWDATEFFDQRRNRGVIYAFRGSTPIEAEHRFSIQGLEANRKYRLRFQDHSALERLASGRELAAGLMVRLAAPNSSELIFIE